MYTPIPNSIAQRRKVLGFSMADIAEVMEIKAGTYGAIESGHALPSKKIFVMLVALFKCEPGDIYLEDAFMRVILDG